MIMRDIEDALPEAAKDIKLNLRSVLEEGALSLPQRYGVAVASAIAAREPRLTQALVATARAVVAEAVIDDAVAAAALMAMNNVYYRFRHMVGKPEYDKKPARLRMNRLVRPRSAREDFELFCLAVSAIHGCETCVRAHEQTVLQAGLREDHVHDAVRIAAVVHGAAIALHAADLPAVGAAMDAERAVAGG
jgi:lipoyl-dependent peroxiredoxin subunit D